MLKRLRYWAVRLFGPCPFRHRTKDRLLRTDDGRMFYFCALCHRQTSQALEDLPVRGIKLPVAVIDKTVWWRRA